MLARRPRVAAREPARRVRIAGAGGGFDVMSGLPLAFALRRLGKTVHLANLTFTYLGATDARQLAPHLYVVDPATASDERYFPEKHLAAWLKDHGHDARVHCFEKTGVAPMREAYRALVSHLEVDTVLLVDGGTDILMSGDEAGLGTPAEDITSLLAADALDGLERKLVVAIGFGVDAFHGVAHADFLENVAALTRAGAYLGAFSLHSGMPEVDAWLEAVDYVQARTPGRESIVCASIADAVRGRFGDHRSVPRTASAPQPLFINPLMSLVWAFELGAVASRCLYRDAIRATSTIFEVHAAIEAFRKGTSVRARRALPM
jgi:hypothetical protein